VSVAEEIHRVLISTPKGSAPHLHRVPIPRKPLLGNCTSLPKMPDVRRLIRFRVRHLCHRLKPQLRRMYVGALLQGFGRRSLVLPESQLIVGSCSAKMLRDRESGVSGEEENCGDGDVLECCL
jgi:hypothetical protein